ncbi:MAG: heavy metal translocating P-type ATPase [Clostridiaceae bacterium]|nr:heavy metal translocating P-type ATPase [Clostridiaceae bacterium]
MQPLILANKNKITAISGILIAIGFFANFVFGSELIFNISFIIASLIGALPIAIQAFQALRFKVISIDLLVTIAVLGAFIIQNYEESAIVTFLFLFGSYLEQRTLNKTRSAIKKLTEMAPDTALLKKDDEFIEVDIDEVEIGNILLVKTGAKVPVDGKVVDGNGYANEASITGESKPVNKDLGKNVYAGTILENGTIQIEAEKVGEDTTFGKIIELVEEAQDSKSSTERFIDKFAKYYTPFVLVMAFVVWLFTKDIELSITILVLGCPGALVIGVPVSNVAGIGNSAKHGVLLKGSEIINDFAKVDSILFDKTGTLTVGNPEVAEKKYYTKDINRALVYLHSIESESDHPLAKAILKDIDVKQKVNIDSTEVIKGGGIVATIDGHEVVVGNPTLLEANNVILTDEIKADISNYEQRGNSLVLMAINQQVQIILGIRDQIRPGVKKDLVKIKKFGVEDLIVLSGDNQGTVDLIAKELGLTKAYGNLLPEEKSAYITNLQEQGKIVAFVGDGVNDSPSLASANIGIAMGSGTDVAIETSDVVMINSDFSKLPDALAITKTISNNMIQNIIIAVGVVIILLSALLFSDWMNMSIGMLVHEGSILAVILNGMRLLRYKPKF